jgi:hypothetical protein
MPTPIDGQGLDSVVLTPEKDSSANTQLAKGQELTGDAKRVADTQAELTKTKMEMAELKGRFAAMQENFATTNKVEEEPEDPDPLDDAEWTEEKITELGMTRQQADFYRDKLVRQQHKIAKLFDARDAALKREFATTLEETVNPDKTAVQAELNELAKLPGFKKLSVKEQIAQAQWLKENRLSGIIKTPPGGTITRSAGNTGGQVDAEAEERRARIEAIKKQKFGGSQLSKKII